MNGLPMRNPLLPAALSVIVLFIGPIGCESKAGNGAIIGGLGGAAIGGLIGNNNGSALGGAAIGGAVGALGGAVVGNEMDKSDRREEENRYTKNYDSNFDAYGNRRR